MKYVLIFKKSYILCLFSILIFSCSDDDEHSMRIQVKPGQSVYGLDMSIFKIQSESATNSIFFEMTRVDPPALYGINFASKAYRINNVPLILSTPLSVNLYYNTSNLMGEEHNLKILVANHIHGPWEPLRTELIMPSNRALAVVETIHYIAVGEVF